MMRTRLLALVGVLFFLGGCTATPDLAKFAEASKELRNGVAEVEEDMLSKVNGLSAAIDFGRSEGWVKKDDGDQLFYEVFTADQASGFQDNTKAFAENLATINASMNIMVLYAEELSNLAAAGETGKEAVETLASSTKSILSTLDIAYPGSSIAAAGVQNALSQVSDLVTRIQAQDALADAMGQAQEPVDRLAELVKHQSLALNDLIGPLVRLRKDAIRGKYGSAKMAYYNKFNSYPKMELLYKSMHDCAKPKLGDDAMIDCHLKREAALGTRLETLARIKEEAASYEKELSVEKAWGRVVKQKLLAVTSAAQAWASTHRKAATLLKECGRMSSLRSKCGNLTVESFMASVEWLKSIKEGFEHADEGE